MILRFTCCTYRGSRLKHLTAVIILLCGVALFVVAVTGAGIVSPEDKISLENSTDSRIELWQFHLDNFLRDPIFVPAHSPLIETLFTITDSQATSEIGAFLWVSEYGCFAGAIVLFWVIRALYQGLRVLIARRGSVEIGYLFCVLVFVSLIMFFLFEDLSRILDWLSFLFWYSMFYLNGSGQSKTTGQLVNLSDHCD